MSDRKELTYSPLKIRTLEVTNIRSRREMNPKVSTYPCSNEMLICMLAVDQYKVSIQNAAV